MTENNPQNINKTEDEIIKDNIVAEIVSLNEGRMTDAQIRPNMAIVMIGDEPQSSKFLEGLEKEGVKVGVDTHSYKCPAESDEEEIKAMIDCLNDDETIDGIYVELPLPDNFKQDEVLSFVKTDKDLNFLVDSELISNSLKEAKLFQGALEKFNEKEESEL